jgi:hypothetical protein
MAKVAEAIEARAFEYTDHLGGATGRLVKETVTLRAMV